jgi:raffinose/stachyose/melibiose transport system substrate-binding protein
MKQTKLFLVISLMLVVFLMAACGGDAAETAVNEAPEAAEEAAVVAEAPAPTAEPAAPDEISGSITVLTNRTDLVDTTFVEYAAQFNEIYPNVEVEFEAMTDYAGEVKIRMNTEDYGDVLLIPDTVPTDQLSDFFEPLGSIADLDPIYTFVTEKSFDGMVYGLPVTGNAQGVVYNKDVFAAAGITELPDTPEAFLDAMRAIKENTDAIPYYTNYAAGWPLVQWESHLGSVSCDENYSNVLVHTAEPFAEGMAHNTIYKLMYDLVAEGLVEVDPSTTDWESSKPMIANGEIGAMVLGSWAIVQMQEFADDPDVIGYMPFPSNLDGKICASAGGDYKIAVNKHSENKEAAMAWLNWFLNDSNFAYDQGGIPPVKGSELPPQLTAFTEMNVEFVASLPAPAGEEGWLNAIDSESEIGLWEPTFRQRIVDAARGNTDESFEDIMADLNGRWAEAQAAVVGDAPATEVVAAEETAVNEDLAGSIIVLTNRTDIVDTTFVEYAAQFNEIYPNVEVEFEAMTDYAGEVKIRMNTEDYGDVLLIPDTIPTNQLPDFFSPLGSIEDLDPVYTFVTEKSFDGMVYGLPVTGNAQGIVYNKAVFEAAGITELPDTPEAFLDAMRAIKENTDATPYYTNYAAGWPLVQWEGHRGSVSCDPNYSNEMVQMEAPFAEGTAHYTIYKLMYDLVAEGLVEVDPSTTDWESSKPMIANGEIGAMVLGSWAIVQMQEFADDPDVIGYMPFPSNIDGQVCAAAGGDYKIGINKYSQNQEAARAWLDWFLNDSNFAYDQGGIPPVKGSDLPPQLAAFTDMNVSFISALPAPVGEEGLLDAIDSEAEIGLWEPTFRQRIVDAARGNTNETFDDIMADLNARWVKAQAEVVGQ